MAQIRTIRYAIRGKGTKKERKVKLRKPIKMYYDTHLKEWVTIPDN